MKVVIQSLRIFAVLCGLSFMIITASCNRGGQEGEPEGGPGMHMPGLKGPFSGGMDVEAIRSLAKDPSKSLHTKVLNDSTTECTLDIADHGVVKATLEKGKLVSLWFCTSKTAKLDKWFAEKVKNLNEAGGGITVGGGDGGVTTKSWSSTDAFWKSTVYRDDKGKFFGNYTITFR